MTPHQKNALEQFRKANGRNWKSKLLSMWEKASYPGFEDISPELQQIRNQLGPTGLLNYQQK